MIQTLTTLVRSKRFDLAVTLLVVFNAILLGLETSDAVMARYGGVIKSLDQIILAIFVIELIMRLVVERMNFWRDPWRIFDFCIVAIALMPASGAFSVLRAFRILRILRLVAAVPSLRRVVGGLIAALPGMGSIVLLMALVFYVFAVMATNLYGDAFPIWFGTLGEAAYSLFQIMTLESWSMGIVRPVMAEFPYAWAFFVPFILATSFTVLNLFIGIIVAAMQSEHDRAIEEEREAMQEEAANVLDEIRALRTEVAALRQEIKPPQS